MSDYTSTNGRRPGWAIAGSLVGLLLLAAALILGIAGIDRADGAGRYGEFDWTVFLIYATPALSALATAILFFMLANVIRRLAQIAEDIEG